MPFDPEVQMRALYRAGDRCECVSEICGDHEGRCREPIPRGQFFAIKTDPTGPDTLENCELICPDCFEHRPI